MDRPTPAIDRNSEIGSYDVTKRAKAKFSTRFLVTDRNHRLYSTVAHVR